ncbi:MAG TPA: toll/interleukin-1 receptor domain-containing protein [Ktedonobacterales bacterium]|nr:toll/interleukin-1 receptor domain-containing protein [Ktedonobacterales bacterium]
MTEQLAARLARASFRPWFDQERTGGHTWWDTILRSIRDCDVFISVVTPDFLKSRACRLEYEYAASLRKRIVPVLVSDGVESNLLPDQLQLIQFVNYRSRGRESWNRLANALADLPLPVSPPDPLPSPPEPPLSPLRDIEKRLQVPNLDFEEQAAIIFAARELLDDPDTTHEAQRVVENVKAYPGLLPSVDRETGQLLRVKGFSRWFRAAEGNGQQQIHIPMTAQEIESRYLESSPVELAVRLIPQVDYRPDGLLGKEERAYVFIGDYLEQRGQTLKQIIANLWMGDALDRVEQANISWVAIVFEIGDMNARTLDILLGTWRAMFRILSDPNRVGIIRSRVCPTNHVASCVR